MRRTWWIYVGAAIGGVLLGALAWIGTSPGTRTPTARTPVATPPGTPTAPVQPSTGPASASPAPTTAPGPPAVWSGQYDNPNPGAGAVSDAADQVMCDPVPDTWSFDEKSAHQVLSAQHVLSRPPLIFRGVKPSATWDADSAAAVVRFQAQHGLPQTGKPGAQFWSCTRKVYAEIKLSVPAWFPPGA